MKGDKATPTNVVKASTTVKLKKPPQAPRRFKSAYMFYSIEQNKQIREKLEAEHKKLPTPEVAKMVSKAWKSLSEEAREPWKDKEKRDRARFEYEASIYKGPWKVPSDQKLKRPMSAFLLFCQDKRETIKMEQPGLPAARMSTILSQLWKEAHSSEKQFYRDRELKLRNLFFKEKADIEQEAISERKDREEKAWEQVNNTPEEAFDFMKKSKIDSKRPKKPMSAFLLFAQGERSQLKLDIPGLSAAKMSSILSERWKGAPEEEKQYYRDMQIRMIVTYRKEKAKFESEMALEDAARAEDTSEEIHAEMKPFFSPHGSYDIDFCQPYIFPPTTSQAQSSSHTERKSTHARLNASRQSVNDIFVEQVKSEQINDSFHFSSMSAKYEAEV